MAKSFPNSMKIYKPTDLKISNSVSKRWRKLHQNCLKPETRKKTSNISRESVITYKGIEVRTRDFSWEIAQMGRWTSCWRGWPHLASHWLTHIWSREQQFMAFYCWPQFPAKADPGTWWWFKWLRSCHPNVRPAWNSQLPVSVPVKAYCRQLINH